jgi:formylglycine-generating enzyme required for sulfatase activity
MLQWKTGEVSNIILSVTKRWSRQRMGRDVTRVWGALFWMMVGMAGTLGAAEPFGLPECTVDFAGEVVVNTALLEAMLAEAEPSGAQPNRQHEMLLIVTKHYLQRSDGLLVLSRTAMDQPPVLLQHDCLPYPATAPTHAPLSDLTLEQKQVLITYYDLVVEPRGSAVSQRVEESDRLASENMAQVPAGAFARGNDKMVDLETFAIDVYEVTNAQYRQFLEAAGYDTQAYWSEAGWHWVQEKSRRQPSYWEDERLRQPEHPVVGVTWYEADAYCRWVGKALPEEIQWEKACRGTDGRKFPWGDAPLPKADETQKQLADLASYAGPVAVGSRPETQSPYGVHDLAGNVLEWTATPRDGEGMVLLGGSGDSTSPRVGCGASHTLLPGISANFIGFRCLTNAR